MMFYKKRNITIYPKLKTIYNHQGCALRWLFLFYPTIKNAIFTFSINPLNVGNSQRADFFVTLGTIGLSQPYNT